MSKFTLVVCAFTLVHLSVWAQSDQFLLPSERVLASVSPSPAPAAKAKPAETPKPPTIITATKEATYDEKTHKAVFFGDVHVDDPEFKITCDQLTAYMRDNSVSSPKAGGSPKAGVSPSPAGKTSPTPKALPTSKASPGASPTGKNAPGGGGLKRAIAEGHVIIVQDKPAANGEEAQHNVGKAQKADYDADTGDVVLTGWPEVSQGGNNQVATEESTVMVMNRDGHTMKTHGASKTLILDQPDNTPKPQ